MPVAIAGTEDPFDGLEYRRDEGADRRTRCDEAFLPFSSKHMTSENGTDYGQITHGITRLNSRDVNKIILLKISHNTPDANIAHGKKTKR